MIGQKNAEKQFYHAEINVIIVFKMTKTLFSDCSANAAILSI